MDATGHWSLSPELKITNRSSYACYGFPGMIGSRPSQYGFPGMIGSINCMH
ncbi:hypothetical protein LINPERPRIM_LOCUS39091 [Linum perenne]